MMNKIRLERLILAGFATLVMFIVAEIFVELIVGKLVLGINLYFPLPNVEHWGVANQILNISLGLVNSVLMIWLYASLRPMFGVGYKTAFIASGIALVLALTMTINVINLGLVPARPALIELIYEAIELPIAMLVGAMVYEGVTEPIPA